MAAAACWGSNGSNNRTNPASSPQGVDAYTRFLALSLRRFAHTCGIKDGWRDGLLGVQRR